MKYAIDRIRKAGVLLALLAMLVPVPVSADIVRLDAKMAQPTALLGDAQTAYLRVELTGLVRPETAPRTPVNVAIVTIDEWVQTGVPQGVVEVSLLPQWGTPNPNFVEDVLAVMGGDRNAPIALICAAGQRSAFAQYLLEKNGFTSVYSISEGMAGSAAGPGWLARGLPVDRCESC